MKKIIFLFLIFFAFEALAMSNDFEKLLPILTKEVKGQEVSPKTTKELEELFKDSDKELPRIFVKKLPSDFAEKGNKKLYSKILAALILRENEQILNERILFSLLKEKFNKGEKWTKQEEAYFNYLVNKYDAIVLKTISSKIADLSLKIDEIPPSLAVAQSALDTDFGKNNAESPFGQMAWLDNQTYAPVKYENLSDAVKEYVKEMNSTPNYDDWRETRFRKTYQQTPKASYHMASNLRTYRPEDVLYVRKIGDLMYKNDFIFGLDDLNLKKN